VGRSYYVRLYIMRCTRTSLWHRKETEAN